MAEQDITITITIPAALATHLDVVDVYALAEEATVKLAAECRGQLERTAEAVIVFGECRDRYLTEAESEEWIEQRSAELSDAMGESLCVAHAPAIASEPEPETPAGASERMMALQAQRAARLHTDAALMLATSGTSLYAALRKAQDELPTLEAIDAWIAEIHAELSTSQPEQGSLFGAGEVGRG